MTPEDLKAVEEQLADLDGKRPDIAERVRDRMREKQRLEAHWFTDLYAALLLWESAPDASIVLPSAAGRRKMGFALRGLLELWKFGPEVCRDRHAYRNAVRDYLAQVGDAMLAEYDRARGEAALDGEPASEESSP